MLRHKERHLVCSAHGDDFTVSSPCSSLDWLKAVMKNKYELTVGGRLGPGPKDNKETSVLNRIIRWTPNGIQYEADPRQVEFFSKRLTWREPIGQSPPDSRYYHIKLSPKLICPSRT